MACQGVLYAKRIKTRQADVLPSEEFQNLDHSGGHTLINTDILAFNSHIPYIYALLSSPPPLEKLLLAATSKIQVENKRGEEHLVPSLSPRYFFILQKLSCPNGSWCWWPQGRKLARLRYSLWIFPLWMRALQHLVLWHLESSTEHVSASGRKQGIPLVRPPWQASSHRKTTTTD